MDFAFEIDNFIPEKLCKIIIDKFENDNRKTKGVARLPNGETYVDNSKKDATEIIISGLSEWDDIDRFLRTKIMEATEIYKNHLVSIFKSKGISDKVIEDMIALQPIYDSGNTIQRITPNSSYPWHQDCSGSNDKYISIILCIIYLNTIDEENGGETEFLYNRKVKPNVGKILLFPATWDYFHQGNYVKCEKYICTTHLYKGV